MKHDKIVNTTCNFLACIIKLTNIYIVYFVFEDINTSFRCFTILKKIEIFTCKYVWHLEFQYNNSMYTIEPMFFSCYGDFSYVLPMFFFFMCFSIFIFLKPLTLDLCAWWWYNSSTIPTIRSVLVARRTPL